MLRPHPSTLLTLTLALGAVALTGGGVRAAPAPTLVALTAEGTLLVFAADQPGAARTVTPQVSGTLVGIDWRPADGKLWGLTDGNDLYTLDVATGAAALASSMTIAFEGAARSGVDFTPQNDRLRLLSDRGQNLRVNVALGATAVDTALRYRDDDPGAGRRPAIVAAGYTENVKDAPATRLLELDHERDALVFQDPPNDGVLTTVGLLGVDVPAEAGFEIVTDPDGTNHGWAAFSGKLWSIDLATGRATPRGAIGTGEATMVGLAQAPSS